MHEDDEGSFWCNAVEDAVAANGELATMGGEHLVAFLEGIGLLANGVVANREEIEFGPVWVVRTNTSINCLRLG